MDSIVSKLVADVAIPKMFKVRQLFPRERVDVRDIPDTIRGLMSREELVSQIRPGMKIAVTAGSRGIANVALITRTIVDFVRERGAKPFIVAAMGSHGGATKEGQLAVLSGLGITEETMGCPIKADMDVVKIGVNEEGMDVMIGRNA